MKRGDTIELSIESIAFGGAGVGHLETEHGRFAVFVEDTVPGDRVLARIGGRKRKHAYGYVDKFIERAGSRVEPHCGHFGLCGDKCGGCSLQYLGYEDQLAVKQRNVSDAIERLGGFDPGVVLPIIGCESPWYYRNKMEFSFGRTLGGRLDLGLHVKRRHHDIVEIKECYLFAPYIGKFIVETREFFRELDDRGLLKELSLQSLYVREGKNTGEVMINLVYENGKAEFLEEFAELVRNFFDTVSDRCLKSVFATEIDNLKGRKRSLREQLLWGEPCIRETLEVAGSELSFEIAPQSFFQPNTVQAQKLYELALSFAGLTGNEIVYDLYCGTGTISLVCALKAKRVYGIEIVESAVNNAKTSAEKNKICNVSFVNADVGEAVTEIKEKPNVIIIDPPRNGLLPNAVAGICPIGTDKIVYVSCSPSTLARDLKIFSKAGYSLEKVQPVDMFPNTYHIECVALLKKASKVG